MNVDGSDITSISSLGDYWGRSTDINPQGTQLVLSKISDSIQERAIWIMNHDGTDKKRIVCDAEHPSYPRFYSNGTKIMFYEYYNKTFYSFDLLLSTSIPIWIPRYDIPVFFLGIGFTIVVLSKKKARNNLFIYRSKKKKISD